MYLNLYRDHETLQLNGINHTVLNDEFGKGIVNLRGGKFVTEGHERVFEPKIVKIISIQTSFGSPRNPRFPYTQNSKFLHFCVDLSVDFEGIESLEDGVIIISTYKVTAI